MKIETDPKKIKGICELYSENVEEDATIFQLYKALAKKYPQSIEKSYITENPWVKLTIYKNVKMKDGGEIKGQHSDYMIWNKPKKSELLKNDISKLIDKLCDMERITQNGKYAYGYVITELYTILRNNVKSPKD